MIKQKYIARKEHYGWLLFNSSTRVIQRVNYDYIKRLKKEGALIREVVNPIIKGALSAPIKIFIDVSNYCNLQCLHCLSGSSPQNKIFLPYERIRELIEECYDLGVFMIKLGSGEQFLREDIWEIGDLIWHKGMEAINTLKRMIKAGINPAIRFTLMTINLRTVSHIVKLSSDLGVKLKVRRAKPQKRTIESGLIIQEASKEYFEALKILNKCRNCEIEDIMNFPGSVRSHLLIGPADCGAGTRSLQFLYIIKGKTPL